MKVTPYTMDPRNAATVRYLQSRPVQPGLSGLVLSIATFLHNTGYLSRGQRETLQSIAKKSGWRDPGPGPVSIDDSGERVKVWVPAGCESVDEGFMAALTEKYRPLGKLGVWCCHDPVYKYVVNPPPMPVTAVHRLITSCGNFTLAGTGWSMGKDRRANPESPHVLNACVGAALSTPDTEYRFHSAKRAGGGSTDWWVFAERRTRQAAEVA